MNKLGQFINKASEIHKNKYSYNKFIYRGFDINGIIACPIHGDFKQDPAHHVYKQQGCPKCGKEIAAKNKTKSFDQFLIEAHSVHENKYSYVQESYTKYKIKMKIICPSHGLFEQTPTNHISKKQGCPQCAILLRKELITKTFQEMIITAKNIHQDRYTYIENSYSNGYSHMTIICPIHGDFKQTPNNHLQGHGCPSCVFKNQSIVAEVLCTLNIKYLTEYKLSIGNKRKYKVDFYLPDYNLIIEYNGEQHYTPQTFGSLTIEAANKKFLKQKKRDVRVRNYCRDSGIYFIEIDGRYYKGKQLRKYLNNMLREYMNKYIK